MDAKPCSEKRRSLAVALLAVPLLLVGYVLSSGPAMWLLDHTDSLQTPINILYSPLFWFCEQYDSLDAALVWWVKLWGPESVGDETG